MGYKHHVQQLTRTCRRRWQWRGGGAENNAAAGGGSFSTRWNRLATLQTSCSHRQWWLTSPNSRGMRVSPSLRNIWGGGQQAQPTTHPPPPAPQQVGVGGMGGGQQVPRDVTYSGIDSVLKKLGHTMYDPATIDAELAVQSGVNPIEPASRRVFRDFVVNVPQFRVYLAMLGGQQHVSIIHIPGVYYSIASAAPTFGCPDS